MLTIPRLQRTGRSARRTVAVLAGLAAAAGGAAVAPTATAQAPDRLSEVYEDWTVECAAREAGAQRCVMVQLLTVSESGQRILHVEISLPEAAPHLALLGPLGVLLPAGVTTAIDGEMPRSHAFHTCLAGGCLARSALEEAEVAALRAGNTMTVTLRAADTGATLNLSVSLKGFTAALKRLHELSAGG